MARRIPLPRLTRRQRLARWQRERRQQVIYLATFTTLLFFVLGLVGWSGASAYYGQNLTPAARVAGHGIPLRDFNRRLLFEKTRFFFDVGVPEGAENDPSLRAQVASLRKGVLDSVVMGDLLSLIARQEGALPSPIEVQARLDHDFGELHVRHILIEPDKEAKDKAKADAEAKARAEEIAKQLRAAPSDEQLWKDVAAKESTDPGSKDKGGDLGWVNAYSGFVKEFEEAMYKLSDSEISDPVKSSFGYHVIQRIQSRPPTQTALYARLRKAGVTVEDLRGVSLTALLRDRYEQRAREAEVPSPQEQAHLAWILIRLPPPTQFEAYSAALKRINAVTEGLAQGKDFAELANENSDDPDTNDKGGDMGWVTRSILEAVEARSSDKNIAADVFSKKAGERSDQHAINAGGDIAVYKVLEKDPARAVTEEQKVKIRDDGFTLWLAQQESRYSVQRLIPGLEF